MCHLCKISGASGFVEAGGSQIPAAISYFGNLARPLLHVLLVQPFDCCQPVVPQRSASLLFSFNDQYTTQL